MRFLGFAVNLLVNSSDFPVSNINFRIFANFRVENDAD